MFLCHSSEDKEKLQRVAAALKEAGIPVWYDEWEIAWGDSLIEKINEGLESCRIP